MTDLAHAFKELLGMYRRERGPMHRDAVARGVAELSAMFTGQRPLRPGYLSRKDLLRAYIEYYLPINASKVARVLDEIRPDRPLRVLDFGCGPGTAALAFRLWGGQASRLVLADVVAEALDEAEVLLGPTFERAEDAPRGPFDLIFATNVIVELEDARRFERILDELDPAGYAVVIEPAMKEPTQRLMAWRDRLVELGWKIAAPCVGAARCPMLAMNDLWCHQDAAWTPPSWIEQIGFPKESLKYSYLVITREGQTRAGAWRVVSNLHREKGKARAWLCGSEGPLWNAEALTRDRDSLRDFFRCRRGDLLAIEGPRSARLAPGCLRIPAKPDTVPPVTSA